MMLNRVKFEPYDLFDFAKILASFFDFTTFGWPKIVETSMQKPLSVNQIVFSRSESNASQQKVDLLL